MAERKTQCDCYARSRSECGCGCDWTDDEVYLLREYVELLRTALKRILAWSNQDEPFLVPVRFVKYVAGNALESTEPKITDDSSARNLLEN